MKVLQGQPINLASPIMGRVSRNGGRLSFRKNAIYVSEEISGNHWGYAAIITGQCVDTDKLPEGKPSVFGLSTTDLNILQEGDVVVLEPGGLISVLWDADSPHNAIFVTDSCNCD